MQESGPERCEQCGGELRRVFFPAGIIFKGSGFYKTDSRSAGPASTSTSAATPAKPAAGGEPKPTSADSDGGGSSSTPAPAKDAGKKESA